MNFHIKDGSRQTRMTFTARSDKMAKL